MGSVFFEIAIILCLAAILAGIFRILRQPAILAYILTGILIGPLGLFRVSGQDFLQTMAEVGITLLLFMIGLEIKLKELPSIGKVAAICGFFQIVLSFIAGFAVASILGFSIVSSAYIATALVFSSTIIVVKLLSDKRDLGSLYAKISIGILLIQDVLAIFILIILSAFKSGQGVGFDQIPLLLLKAFVIFGWIIVLSRSIIPRVVEIFAKSSETLFLISIAWVFGLSAAVASQPIGFSIEIGGFLAGLALSGSIANYQIIAKVKILRDFFIILFFVLLGIQMKFASIQSLIFPAVVLSAFVLFGKPLIVTTVMGAQGFRKRTSFLTGISLAQISEFSLIIVFLGASIHQIPVRIVSLITLVGIITFTLSTYVIIDGNKIYLKIHRRLSIFERRKIKKEEVIDPDNISNLSGHVVVVGGDILGKSIIEALSKDEHVVVVDFDPSIVRKLEGKSVSRLFGDITDFDIQERANLRGARLVISTIPDVEDNLLLLQMLAHENREVKVLMMALEVRDAKTLYRAGADYVILPHLAAGSQIAKIIKEDKLDLLDAVKRGDLKSIS